MTDANRFDAGLKTRKAVLGEAYVQRSLEGATEFTRPMQQLVTEWCWNDVWNRPGLDRKTRSLLNLAMLTALNRQHELAAHVRGALTNGASREEIGEVILQAAIYCGMPAGLDSFRTAQKVFDEDAA